MRSARAAYLLGAAAVAASQAASLVAGIASLWLLARILSKEMFGGYAFAVAVIALLSYVATLGLDRSLLLRIARHRISPGQLRGGGLAARATLIACAAGGVLALGLSLGAAPLVRLGALPEAGFWLPALALAILPMAATTMLQAWFQANHRVPASAAAPGLADLLRSLLFAVVLASGLGAAGVAGAVTIAAAAPAAMLLGLAWGRARAAPRRFAKGDFVKGWQFLTLRLSTQGVRQVDLVMMGLLATGGATAEYAIAARIAILADYGRAALKPSFSPRARRWLASGDLAAAFREFDHARHAGLAAALAVAAAFVLLGQPLLGLFGSFEAAYPLLLLLAAGYLVNAGFGMHASYLAMSGEVGWSALLRIGALGLLVALNLVLIPRYGAIGAAAAALVTQVLVNVVGAALAYRLVGLRAVDLPLVLIIAAAAGGMAVAAFGGARHDLAAGVLTAALVIVLLRSRRLLVALARVFAGRVQSAFK